MIRPAHLIVPNNRSAYAVALSLRDPQTLDDLLSCRRQCLYALSGAPVIRLLEGCCGSSRRVRNWAEIDGMSDGG